MGMGKRKTITVEKLSRMMVEGIDKLPGPVEHNGERKGWVGIGWVTEGKADGTEPLLITDE